MTLRKKPVENIMGKGENARNQHFLLLPQCFLSLQQKYSSLLVEFYIDVSEYIQIEQVYNSVICNEIINKGKGNNSLTFQRFHLFPFF